MASKKFIFGQDENTNSAKIKFVDTSVFSKIDEKTKAEEWFYLTEYGVIGPYESKKFAERCFAAFVEIQDIVMIRDQ